LNQIELYYLYIQEQLIYIKYFLIQQFYFMRPVPLCNWPYGFCACTLLITYNHHHRRRRRRRRRHNNNNNNRSWEV
jgi:hypothetical protein